jgi:hypothetical protein
VIGVGGGLWGNRREKIGLGYYTDDILLRRLCLFDFLLNTCPPRCLPYKAFGLRGDEAPKNIGEGNQHVST